MKKLSLFILPVTAIFLLVNCSNVSTKAPEISEYDSLLIEFNNLFGVKSDLQTTTDVMINSGIVYDATLTLDTLQQEVYTSTMPISALFCGIYSADALYHAAFNKDDASFESYTAAQILANELGIGPYYVESLLKRDDDGITEADSLIFKFNAALAESDTSLSDNKRIRIISSYLLGNIIEKLYLVNKGVATLENKPITEISKQAQYLFQLLIAEEETVDLFVQLLDKYSKEPGNQLHIEMITLQSLYKALSAKGIPNYLPTDLFIPTVEMTNISTQVENIRALMVGL